MLGGSFLRPRVKVLDKKPRLTCVAKTVHASIHVSRCSKSLQKHRFFFSLFVIVCFFCFFLNYDYLKCLWGLENLLMTLINIIPNLDHLAQDFGIAKTSIAHKGPNSMSLPVDDGVSVEAEEELKVVPVGQVGHSVGHVWHSVGHVGHSVGQTVTVSLGYAGQLQLVVPSVVVDITGAVVDVMIVELLGDVDEVVLAYRVVWAASVVDEQTGQFVVLIIGQSVVGSNVGHDVAASVVGFVVTVGQGVQVGTVGVVHGIAVVVVVGLAVLVVKQGGQVGAVVGVGVVTMICGSSTARTTVSYRVSSSICVALMTT